MTQDQYLVTADKKAFFSKWSQYMTRADQSVIVCDKKVYKLYVEKMLKELFFKTKPLVYFVEEGEEGKTRKSKEGLEDFLFKHKISKKGLLVGIGGGAVLDLVGFTASTYLRSINYISIPTTLLAMVDSCVGGKTAINTRFGKNTLGSFYLPLGVLTFIPFTQSLNLDQNFDGLAEVIKYSIIKDPSILENVNAVYLNSRDKSALLGIVNTGQRIKQAVVDRDFMDSGARQILNFGHTVAHAIEVLHGFKISHGHAVALGMLVETFISIEQKIAPAHLLKDLFQVLKDINFNLKILEPKPLTHYLEVMSRDKKNREKGKIYFVMVQDWGKCYAANNHFSHSAPMHTIEKALDWMHANFSKPKSEVKCGLYVK
ncbi:3-dehydroquinate synthase [Candidatus Aerophobetes bacterium]|uniref:3-dehydroquinate synthase n=1 Tax=Aerophobetes bacterium TaxID=2030807 RepID=A0A2A4WY65_UNCAE|nr:MAG: 3-dehydroquinate synthase [Candidatus Aerophobetes bacterium]